MSDTSTILRQQLQQLEAELRAASLWSTLPPSEEAMASVMPFMYDTLQIEEWLQWVFMPRLHALLDAEATLPSNCSVHPLAEHEWTNRLPNGTHAAALKLLAEIDATLNRA
ncbi:YqcC family protein [Comamonas sp. NoAH]|uniref:YqcC family protein n=1 Tax=Comamonas halotolerans TaxID=3041496 RepID=UPI0024E0BFB9|nr:YqcC family protein [Comamonas sp. NoAH]